MTTATANSTTDATEFDPEYFYRHLRGPKYGFAVGVGWLSALLSICGVGTMIYLILRQRKYTGLFHRLILGMCTADLIASTQVYFHFFAMPKWTGTPLAQGNTSSCAAIAVPFLVQHASNMYSCQLAGYFLLMIRYRWSEERLVKKFEPWVHILPWIIPTIAISFLLATKAFNPHYLFGVCSFFQYPVDCRVNDQIDCERGGHFLQQYVAFLYYGSSMIMSIVGTVWTWLMYRHVQAMGKRGAARSMDRGAFIYKRTRAVSLQSIWYTVVYASAFFFIFFGFVVTLILEADDFYGAPDDPIIMFLIYLLYFLYPIQGFLNFLVYMVRITCM